MNDREYDYIASMVDVFEDLPDGAFFAALADSGISNYDLIRYEEEKEKRKARQKIRLKKRKKNQKKRRRKGKRNYQFYEDNEPTSEGQ